MTDQRISTAATVEDLNVDLTKAEEVKGGSQTDYLLLTDGIAGESSRRASTPSVSEIVLTKITD